NNELRDRDEFDRVLRIRAEVHKYARLKTNKKELILRQFYEEPANKVRKDLEKIKAPEKISIQILREYIKLHLKDELKNISSDNEDLSDEENIRFSKLLGLIIDMQRLIHKNHDKLELSNE